MFIDFNECITLVRENTLPIVENSADGHCGGTEANNALFYLLLNFAMNLKLL